MMNAAQMITVSALFIYRSLKKESRGFCAIVHVYEYFLHILEQRIGFAQQIQVKAKLVEYKCENKLVF